MILSIEFGTILLSSDALMLAISKTVNLTLFLFVMYIFVRKPIAQFFKERTTLVRETLEKAAKDKAEAETKMTELNRRINKLDTEVGEIKNIARKEAEAERARIEAETKRDIDKYRISAGREIDSAKQVALAELKEFAAIKAVDLAEQIIRKEIKLEDDVKLSARVTAELTSNN